MGGQSADKIRDIGSKGIELSFWINRCFNGRMNQKIKTRIRLTITLGPFAVNYSFLYTQVVIIYTFPSGIPPNN